jgi:hypothetical protein
LVNTIPENRDIYLEDIILESLNKLNSVELIIFIDRVMGEKTYVEIGKYLETNQFAVRRKFFVICGKLKQILDKYML